MQAASATAPATLPAPLTGVRHIVVLRPCAVGDFVFALPALAALRATYPQAHITLLGRAWQAELLAGRPGPVDEVRVLPTVPGVGAPADAVEDTAAVTALLDALNARGVDLAIQLYGGGGYANPFLLRIAARHRIGLRAPDAPALDRTLPYVYLQNERLRLLETVGLAGAHATTLDARLAVLPDDLAQAARCVPMDDAKPLVVIQPGATDPRRCWAPARFAAVADALAEAGARIAVNGSEAERDRVRAVITAMRADALDLATPQLSLSGLLGLLSRATLLVSNDTGPLHLAQAVGTASVGIYWFTNLLISAPLAAARHRHAVSLQVHCPVCGRENVTAHCGHPASFVDAVGVDEVRTLALALYREELARG
ncbi:glycosyltransferase family 9 protein [Chitiniphilus purpureus]|uniref:Glycosyltransferase family 9 protein n=1 Tax=Chitiniphilus purpureus TaxID=2981137 RepID=A0ABY6DPM7_9NEIS|nr:glycosyltransferase family 9 protein [Chitiniphilus sp. CD1]UXY16306.1 glycosyltransferase family 9 protein [Chitiniphilus sp. CD1]